MPAARFELRFNLSPGRLPVDHGFRLYSALCYHLPWLHEFNECLIATLSGEYVGNGWLETTGQLRIRTPLESVPDFLRLQGKRLEIEGCQIKVGAGAVHPLEPSPRLTAYYVTTKQGNDEAWFDAETKRQLEALGIRQPLERGKRKTITIHGKRIVGHACRLDRLPPAESIALQSFGLGGRKKMGGGWFEA